MEEVRGCRTVWTSIRKPIRAGRLTGSVPRILVWRRGISDFEYLFAELHQLKQDQLSADPVQLLVLGFLICSHDIE
jgi:hypothetical protein